jgi:uncharacterized protein YutE (UPF0331/DUF86 family)
MIIRGFMDSSFSPPAPAVKAFISIEKLKVKGYMKFLLDTGASATAILDRDRRAREAPVHIRLGVKGVLSEGLASRLASAARLRNLLVHRYWVISDEKVYESVKNGLKDFEEFITCVRVFLKRGRVEL